ncbi:hypothetical protein [Paraburkholderia mimosarum]|uniref:hypothetical protein n=1 Tax=Paraburkholderia mimosarum TaxID=312026 RepID=UPI00040EC3A2|nr:hypothetical protein [Paraburkholderia mimosarum]
MQRVDVWLHLRRIGLAQNGEEVATSIGTIRSDEERLVRISGKLNARFGEVEQEPS